MFGSLVTTKELKDMFSYLVRIPSIVYNSNELIYTLITFNFKNLNPWHFAGKIYSANDQGKKTV